MASFDPTAPVTALQFMTDLVYLYDDYWRGPKSIVGGPVIDYSFDTAHTTDIIRRKGWGQPRVEVKGIPQTHLVSRGTLTEREHLNTVIAQINAGLYHIDNNSQLLLSIPLTNNTSNLITASEFELVRTTVTDTIATSKLLCQDDVNLDLSVYTEDNASVPWNDDLYIVHKFEFDNYNAARHYFNAGGLLTLQLDTDSSGTSYSEIWSAIFDSVGYVGIGATNTLSYNGTQDVGPNIGVDRGFYSLPSTGSPITLYEAAGAYFNGDNDNSNIIVQSVYNSRRLRVSAKGTETPTSFDIDVRVELIEDADDDYPINTLITLSSGYKQPSDSPDPLSNVDRGPYIGLPGNTQYRFTELPAPNISTQTPWTPDELANAEQVDWQQPDPGHTWTAGTGTTEYTRIYVLTATPDTVIEGNSVTISLTTSTTVPSGTVVPYTITGVSSADLSGASLTGNFVTDTTDSVILAVATGVTSENIVFELDADAPAVDVDPAGPKDTITIPIQPAP